jgi:hypothetical protein
MNIDRHVGVFFCNGLNVDRQEARKNAETASKRHKCTAITIIEGGRYCSHDGDYKGKSFS